MVKVESGNLLKSEVDALVNTVNTVGVMGKGVAYQFKQAYPENTKAYESACKRNEIKLGQMFVTFTGQFQPSLIINFPTKSHWKANSRIEDIESGLADLIRVVKEHQIRSIGLPPLGCGFGGLRWEDVRPLIERAFESVPDVAVHLFAPGQVVPADESIIRTPKPAMNAWRAALIKILKSYSSLGFEASHIEAQKLIYFLVQAGEPLKSKFIKGIYGPYDEGMKYGIQAMDGHYVRGFGEGAREQVVTLAPNATIEADDFISTAERASEARSRIERVTCLIEGFETPYGLELLATLHWVVSSEGASNIDEAIQRVWDWNPRKRMVMKESHLRIAWKRLEEEGWLNKG